MDDRELLWHQYSATIDMYKFYVEVVIKLNAFYYVVTGGLLTFYLAHADQPRIRFCLVLPILIGICLACLFLYGAQLLEVWRKEIFSIRDKLGLYSAPEFKVLSVLLYSSGAILIVVSFALLALILNFFSVPVCAP